MPQTGELCSICLTKSSSRFTVTSKFEPEVLQQCFGLTDTRKGKLCDGCRRAVYKFKRNPKFLFNNLVDSKGQKHITKKNIHKNTGKRLAEWKKINASTSGLCRSTLQTFPNEIILHILRFLSPKELIAIQAVSKTFFDFCTDFDEVVWLPVVKSEYSSLYDNISINSTPVNSWKAVYFFFNSTKSYVSRMDQVNERFTHHFISQNQILREQRDQALNESERAYKELELLKNFNGDSLSPDQE